MKKIALFICTLILAAAVAFAVSADDAKFTVELTGPEVVNAGKTVAQVGNLQSGDKSTIHSWAVEDGSFTDGTKSHTKLRMELSNFMPLRDLPMLKTQ
ncbi:MAG: hypothetical protein BHW37_06870 [Firmicutes bacterium CAG:272_52_7]|nr:MAG: hypothetical protein BHW37_06870 [Firmicutes bacterium CAG:272_52_7]